MHTRRHPDKPENEIWVEIRLDADWQAAYLLVAQDGRHVIAEVHLIPYENERSALLSPGEWSRSSVPAGGVPFDKLRALRTDEVLRAVRDYLDSHTDPAHVDRVLPRFKLEREGVADVVPRRPRRSDADVARAAERWAEAPHGQRRRTVADATDYSESNVAKMIRDARDRGFLAGNELTARARQILGNVPRRSR